MLIAHTEQLFYYIFEIFYKYYFILTEDVVLSTIPFFQFPNMTFMKKFNKYAKNEFLKHNIDVEIIFRFGNEFSVFFWNFNKRV